MERSQLEQNVLRKSLKVKYAADVTEWLYSKEFNDYVQSWSSLVDYYKGHDDGTVTMIGLEVLSDFLHTTNFLRQLRGDRKLTQHHEEVEEALADLEGWMDDIVAEAYARIHADEDESLT